MADDWSNVISFDSPASDGWGSVVALADEDWNKVLAFEPAPPAPGPFQLPIEARIPPAAIHRLEDELAATPVRVVPGGNAVNPRYQELQAALHGARQSMAVPLAADLERAKRGATPEQFAIQEQLPGFLTDSPMPVRRALSGLLGIGTTVASLAGRATGLVDSDELNRAQAASQQLQGYRDRQLGGTLAEDIGSVGESVVQMGAAGAMGGFPAVIGAVVASASDAAYTAAKDRGLPPLQAAGYAVSVGAIEGITTLLFGKLGQKLGINSLEESLSPGVKAAANRLLERSGLLRRLGAVSLETGEEGTISLLSSLNDYGLGGDDKALDTIWSDYATATRRGAMGGTVASSIEEAKRAWGKVKREAPAVLDAVRAAEEFAAKATPEQAAKAAESTGRRGFEEATGQKKTSQQYRDDFKGELQRALAAEPEYAGADLTSSDTAVEVDTPLEADTPLEELPPSAITHRERPTRNPVEQPVTPDVIPQPGPQPRPLPRFDQRIQDLSDRNAVSMGTVEFLNEKLQEDPAWIDQVFDEADRRAVEDNARIDAARSQFRTLFKRGRAAMAQNEAQEKRANKLDTVDLTNLIRKAKMGAAKGLDPESIFPWWDSTVRQLEGYRTEDVASFEGRAPEYAELLSFLRDDDLSHGLFELLQGGVAQFTKASRDQHIDDAIDAMVDAEERAAATFNPAEWDPDYTQGDFYRADPRRQGESNEFDAREADAEGEFARKLRGIPLPEMVELAHTLLGKYPSVDAVIQALGIFRRRGADGAIGINPSLGSDPALLAKVLAHEIGHLADWLPDKTMARGNLLGRIASLRDHMGAWLAGRPGGEPPLSDADIDRLRKIARELLEAETPKDAQRIIEEQIASELPITPQDVMNIWNSIDQSKIKPTLQRYVKGLTAIEKLSIVKEAMKGVVAEKVQEWVAKMEPKGGQAADPAEKRITAKAVEERLRKLIEEEIRKRELLSVSAVREELIELTKWWSGDWEGAPKWYEKYRRSGKELYAEALSVFLNTPGDLARRAPEFYRGLSSYIGEKPEVFAEYMRLQDILNGTPEDVADRRQYRVYDMFQRADDKIRAAREAAAAAKRSSLEAVKNWLHAYIYDNLSPLKETAGGDTAAHYLLDELHTIDSPNEAYLSRLDRTAIQPITEAGMSIDELGALLLFNRIAKGDREGLVNPLGHSPDSAQRQLDHMERTLGPEKWRILNRAAHAFYGESQAILQRAHDAGLISPAKFLGLQENDEYATFWVADYIDSPRVSPAIRAQIGTFKEVANPFEATLLKMMAMNRLAALNEARGIVINNLKGSFASDIRPAKLGYRQREPSKRARPGMEYLHHIERGTHVVYEVPKNIVTSFQHNDIGGLQRMAAVANSAVYSVFHPLYVTASAGFTVANPFRDILRTWKNLGAIAARKGFKAPTLREILGQVVKNFDVAYARAKGKADPRVEALFEDHVLGARLADVIGDESDSEYRRLLRERGLLTTHSQNRLIRAGQKVLAFLEAVGTFQETAVKAAANELLADRGLPPRERAYIVRKYAGTPDYYQKGHATTLLQSIFMYARVKLNGLVTDAQLATSRDTAAAYWWRSLAANIMPATLTRLGIYGFFGPAVAALFGGDDEDDPYKKVSRRLADNYILVPLGTLGEAGRSKGVFLSIPQDDTGRIVSTLWGNLLDAVVGSPRHASRGAALNAVFGEAFSATIPTYNPLISMASKWAQYGRGENPTDTFYGTPIVPRREWEAGGWSATRKMLAWTGDQFGVASDAAHPLLEAAFGAPYQSDDESTIEIMARSIPGLSRILRVTDAGINEAEWAAINAEEQEGARFRLGLPASVRKLTTARYMLMQHQDRTSRDEQQYKRLNRWYRNYLRATEAIRAAEERGADSSAFRESLQMESDALLRDL